MQVELIALMGSDVQIEQMARISNPAASASAGSGRLLPYLIKHKHWSPFEMANVVMSIECPRDIARQVLRHRSFTFQEFSQRYSNPLKWLGMHVRNARLQDKNNRQASLPLTLGDAVMDEEWVNKQRAIMSSVEEAYTWATNNNIAKEVARAIIPEGLVYSRMYVNGTLLSWMHYCLLRMGNGTQQEHAELAKMCWGVLKNCFPIVCSAMEEENVLES
jgi:thymidylate synthase (FAD)